MNIFSKIAEAESLGLIKPGEFYGNNLGFSKYLVGAHGEVISFVSKPRKLKPTKRGKYLGFTLSNDQGELKPVYLHRIVAELVYGLCPDGMECCHNDGNKANNDFMNLRWDTHKANENDKPVRPAGELNPMAKFSKQTVDQIRALFLLGERQCDLASAFSMSRMNVSRIVRNQAWKG